MSDTSTQERFVQDGKAVRLSNGLRFPIEMWVQMHPEDREAFVEIGVEEAVEQWATL